MSTKFTEIYNCFLNKITDDMYMELTPADTIKDLQRLLLCAIPEFEFPRIVLQGNYVVQTSQKLEEDVLEDDFVIGYIWNEIETDEFPDDLTSQMVVVENSYFKCNLTHEEINILAIIMVREWLQRQVTSIENTRMKYSGSDFKFTSQANHLAKLLSLQTEVRRESMHMQRLYKRRRTTVNGHIRSNWDVLRFGVYTPHILDGFKDGFSFEDGDEWPGMNNPSNDSNSTNCNPIWHELEQRKNGQ